VNPSGIDDTELVAGDAANLVIEATSVPEGDLRDRANLAEGTNQFLESQLEDAKRR
jgi:hypothetical protein